MTRVKVATALAAQLVQRHSRDAIPQLLTLVATSIVVSGGPDGDGGAPDLDLMFGIGAHRSILSHSILMGAALETGFLSLEQLVRLLHARLPVEHDPLWDELSRHAASIAQTANSGASIGMSYHLLIDGLLQPGAYHDLPVSMPMEAHQSILVAHSAAEAIDVAHEPAPVSVPMGASRIAPRASERKVTRAPSTVSNDLTRAEPYKPGHVPWWEAATPQEVAAVKLRHRSSLRESFLNLSRAVRC